MKTNKTFKIGDFEINRIGFGTMRVTTGSGIWGDTPNKENAINVIRTAIEHGVNFIDTADAYGPYTSELLVEEAVRPYKDQVMIATKGGFIKYQPGAVLPNGHPYYLRTALEGSLRRMNTDSIDLYFLHKVDPNIPIEESVGALAQLQREGKIKHLGISNVTPEELKRAQSVATIDAVQNAFNYADRNAEDLVRATSARDIAFIAHTPVARGNWNDPTVTKAGKEGMTSNQLALSWLLHFAPNIIAIPGTSSQTHLMENLQSYTLKPESYEEA